MRKKSLTSSKWFAGWRKQFILSSRRGKGESEIGSNFCLHCLVIALPSTKGILKQSQFSDAVSTVEHLVWIVIGSSRRLFVLIGRSNCVAFVLTKFN